MIRTGKLFKKLMILSLIWTSYSLAQSQKEFIEDNSRNPEIEFNIGRETILNSPTTIKNFKVLNPKEIEKSGFEKYKHLKNLGDYSKIKISPKTQYDWSIKSIKSLKETGVHKAILKEGSILWSLDMEGAYKVDRDIYINVIHGVDERGFAYILNLKNEVRYKTIYDNIINIKKVSNLTIPPERFKPIPKSQLRGPYIITKEQMKDKKQFFQEASIFYLNKTSTNLKSINGTDSGESIGNTSGVGFQYQGFFDFNFVTLFGYSFEVSRATASSNLNDYDQTQITIGPVVNFKIGNLFDRKLLAQIGTQFSIYDHVNQTGGSNIRDVSYSTQTFNFGLRSYIGTKTGDILLGVNYGIDRANPDDEDLSLNGADQTVRDQRFTLNMGWTW